MATHLPIQIFDEYYLGGSLFFIAVWLAIAFYLSSKYDYDKGHDLLLGSCFTSLAIILLFMGGSTAALQIVPSIVVMLWGVRMAYFTRIYTENIDPMPKKPGMKLWKKLRPTWRIAILFILEALWVWLSCLPIIVLNSPAVLQHEQPSMTGLAIGVEVVMLSLTFLLYTPADLIHYPGVAGGSDPTDPSYCLRRWGPNALVEFFFQTFLTLFFTTLDKNDSHPKGFVADSGPLSSLEAAMLFYCVFIGAWLVVEMVVHRMYSKR